MAKERGGERRRGRPGGGGRDCRPRRSGPPRPGGQRSGPPRGGSGEPPRDFIPRPARDTYPPRPGGYAPRSAPDEGGMAIRVDPRRLTLLKELAAGEGLRPGQLVQRWVEERLDAERSGQSPSSAVADPRIAVIESTLAALAARIGEISQRVQAVPSALPAPAPRRRG